jgi:PTH1 family peptidyl-tRNA hydrolase
MKLVVGLGNPGQKYARNRHNVGFMALERIAAEQGAQPWRRRFQGRATECTLGGERALLLLPDTYMNESGRAVGEAARFLKIAPGDVVVLHDELDLAPGRLKVKTGGGDAGHNGLRSITAHIGNAYVRVRIGIGHPGAKELVHAWVLHDFAKADETWLEPLLEAIAMAAGRLGEGKFDRFQSDVALRLEAVAGKSGSERPARPNDDGGRPRDREFGASKPRAAASGESPSSAQAPPRSALAERLAGWLKGEKGT